jgi:hypothetical protein
LRHPFGIKEKNEEIRTRNKRNISNIHKLPYPGIQRVNLNFKLDSIIYETNISIYEEKEKEKQ